MEKNQPPVPDFTDPRFFARRWRGEKYDEYIHRARTLLEIENYLEIGVARGASLATVTCPVIGIDPDFRIEQDLVSNKPVSHFFQCTSDYFFQNYNPKAIFGKPISMAFLDGMHLFEFLLRDFYNTEKYCSPNSVIILHDCLPTDLGMTRRDPRQSTEPTRRGLWTGDVWKVLMTLRKYRPDLKILPLNAPPTGLVFISNLDPNNNFLEEHYDDILREGENWNLKEIGVQAFISSQNVEATAAYQTKESLVARLSP